MTCLEFVILADTAEYDASGTPVEFEVDALRFEFEVSSCP